MIVKLYIQLKSENTYQIPNQKQIQGESANNNPSGILSFGLEINPQKFPTSKLRNEGVYPNCTSLGHIVHKIVEILLMPSFMFSIELAKEIRINPSPNLPKEVPESKATPPS